ncbi:MAG: YqeG family HAD IIIA-type phosphatase [Clostridia bacterium]|nr:YqeG family HAD IIIA-type phosphatase [Clostridia bacterium]
MIKELYPYEYVESVFTIDYEELYQKNFRGIIFDIDNTLVPHGADSNEEVDNLFKMIQAIGFKTLVLSNNTEERVRRFLRNIDSLYICDAEKPKTENFLKAVEMLELEKKQIIYVGDQIFTDIYGANRSGITNILVKYIGYYVKGKKGIKRGIEKFILKVYNTKTKYKHRLGKIEK